MSDDITVNYYYQYYPGGVKKVIASGTSAFIGLVDDTTVFKYPLAPGKEVCRLEAERKLLEAVGPHPRIIGLKGFADEGIYLEHAVNGTVADFLLGSGNPPPSVQQRLAWCREATEAVAHVHSRRVLHCDIQPTNMLLDQDLHLKLSDFQGKLLSEDGEILVDGWSSEPCRFSYPRDDNSFINVKTDLFALGCTIYFIIKGHAVYPDIIDGEDKYYLKVEERFARKEFPQDKHICSDITLKCWLLQYESAEEVLRDIESVEKLVSSGLNGENAE